MECSFLFLACPFTGNNSLKTISLSGCVLPGSLPFLSFPLAHCQVLCSFSVYHLLGCKDVLNPHSHLLLHPQSGGALIWEILGGWASSRLELLASLASKPVQVQPSQAWRVEDPVLMSPASMHNFRQTILPAGASSGSSRQSNNPWLLDQ